MNMAMIVNTKYNSLVYTQGLAFSDYFFVVVVVTGFFLHRFRSLVYVMFKETSSSNDDNDRNSHIQIPHLHSHRRTLHLFDILENHLFTLLMLSFVSIRFISFSFVFNAIAIVIPKVRCSQFSLCVTKMNEDK